MQCEKRNLTVRGRKRYYDFSCSFRKRLFELFGFKIVLPVSNLNENYFEILNTDIANSENKVIDDLVIINSKIPYKTKKDLKEIFRSCYNESVISLKSKVHVELEIKLRRDQPFYFKLRRGIPPPEVLLDLVSLNITHPLC